jgi:hypothetical protein
MTDQTGKNNIERWNLELAKKINAEDNLERVYFSGQQKMVQLKKKMNTNSNRNTHLNIVLQSYSSG